MINTYKDEMLYNINYYIRYLYYHLIYNKEINCDIPEYEYN